MNKSTTDFKALSERILKDTLMGMGEEYYAIGNTKILMRNEILAILEKAKAKAVLLFITYIYIERIKR
jgi:myosin heavy subunit